MLGKLVDGVLVRPPKEIIESRPRKIVESYTTEDGEEVATEYTIEESVRYVGMTDAFLIARGYKPVKYAPMPSDADKYEYSEEYSETDSDITVSWVRGKEKAKSINDRIDTIEQEVSSVSDAVNMLMFGV